MTRPDELAVWLHGERLGSVAPTSRGGDRLALRYDDATTDRVSGAPVLSCSLLPGSTRHDATAFVDGLLPEGDVRRAFAARAQLPAHDLFGLIHRYGRDVAGAVQFLEPGVEPDPLAGDVEPLDDDTLARLVVELDDNPFALADDSELSLAGLQNKMLLVALDDGRWGRPRHGHPSTHILKRDHPRHRGIVAAESDTLALARHVGLTTTAAHVERLGDDDCIIVERYDRIIESGRVVARVHQEDMCQALGLPATRKYETRQGGGGPEFSQIAALLDRHAVDPLDQLDRLVEIAAFTAIIGNADAHGKNLSFVLRDGHVELAPLYDLVPTVLWPSLTTDAAMTIGGMVSLDGVSIPMLEAEARSWRHSARRARAVAIRCCERVREALDLEVIDPESPLAEYVRARTARLLDSG